MAADRPHASGRFQVLERRAARPYWQLQLELAGVLAVWTLPQGPSLDPLVKCLAVAGDAQPIAHLACSDESALPWDAGTYALDEGTDPGPARDLGRLSFSLAGAFLRGGFTLVRMGGRYGGRNWLLTKRSDARAVPGWTMFALDPAVSGVRPAPVRRQ